MKKEFIGQKNLQNKDFLMLNTYWHFAIMKEKELRKINNKLYIGLIKRVIISTGSVKIPPITIVVTKLVKC
jgi:hypothetical protein